MPSAIARAYSTMDHRFQPRPGRRTGGQEGSGEPCSRDQEPGTRRLPLPLRRPAGGSREGSALVDILGVKLGGLIGAFIWKGFTCTSWATTSIGRTYSPTGLSTCSAARTPPSSSKAVSGRILTPDASGLKLAHLRDAPPYCWRVCCHRAPPIEIAMRS